MRKAATKKGGSVENYRISKPWEKGGMDVAVVVRKGFFDEKRRKKRKDAIAIAVSLKEICLWEEST
jgi:hypothetical protein